MAFSANNIFSRVWAAGKGPSQPIPKTENPLKFGILGAANIAPFALINPALFCEEAVVHGVAARDKSKAEAFGNKYGIPKIYGSYEDLINDPEIEVVYIPTPNSLHFKWASKSLQAGKHVLCEKPLTSNEQEALELVKIAQESGKVFFEAFHYRYHPASKRFKKIIEGGEIGEIKSIEAKVSLPSVFFAADDIRFNYSLSGGALMDCGCYAVNAVRYFSGMEPEVVKSYCIASNKVTGIKDESERTQVDATTSAQFSFPNNSTGSIDCTLNGSLFYGLIPTVKVVGTNGSAELNNFVNPFLYHKIIVKQEGKPTREEKDYGNGTSTFCYQLEAFIKAVRNNEPFLSTAEDGAKNMRVIDQIYTKAALKPRGN